MLPVNVESDPALAEFGGRGGEREGRTGKRRAADLRLGAL